MLTEATSNLALFYGQLAQAPLIRCSSQNQSGISARKRSLPTQIVSPPKRQRRVMAPSFCFTVQEMRPHSKVTDVVDGQGVWHPPQAKGHNVTTGTTQAFRCNGTTIEPIPVSTVPLNTSTALYGTTSVYVYQDAFHIVNYDATQYAVGSGIDEPPSASPTPSSRSDSPHQYLSAPQLRQTPIQAEQLQAQQQQTTSHNLPSWARLRFQHLPARHAFRSFATPEGSAIRLQTQRPDQAWWARRLLPEAYWAPNKAWTHVQDKGGLVGELPLLMALVAFSVPALYLETVFTECFGDGSWDFGFVRDVPHGRKYLHPPS